MLSYFITISLLISKGDNIQVTRKHEQRYNDAARP